MKTIAITLFLSFGGLIAVALLSLRWLEDNFGPLAVILTVVALMVAALVIIIMVLLGLFSLAQLNIFSGALANVADVHITNAKNYGKLLGNARRSADPDPTTIDAQWWETPALPEPQPASDGLLGMVRKALPGKQAPPASPRQLPGAVAPTWPEDSTDYADRLIVS